MPSPEVSPTLPLVSPTAVISRPTTTPTKSLSPIISPTGGKYTLDDFKEVFGTSNPEFDINKDGVVNSADWILYQEQERQVP